jgi:hypothetical protein
VEETLCHTQAVGGILRKVASNAYGEYEKGSIKHLIAAQL